MNLHILKSQESFGMHTIIKDPNDHLISIAQIKRKPTEDDFDLFGLLGAESDSIHCSVGSWREMMMIMVDSFVEKTCISNICKKVVKYASCIRVCYSLSEKQHKKYSGNKSVFNINVDIKQCYKSSRCIS